MRYKKCIMLVLALMIILSAAISATSAMACLGCSPGYWKNHEEVWRWYFDGNLLIYPEGYADDLLADLGAHGGPNTGKPRREAATAILNFKMNLNLFPLANCDD